MASTGIVYCQLAFLVLAVSTKAPSLLFVEACIPIPSQVCELTMTLSVTRELGFDEDSLLRLEVPCY
jgi:hypothetical protein